MQNQVYVRLENFVSTPTHSAHLKTKANKYWGKILQVIFVEKTLMKKFEWNDINVNN